MKRHIGSIVNVLSLTLVVALSVCLWIEHQRFVTVSNALREKQALIPVAAAPSTDGAERNRVPVAGVLKGPANAPITIVEFADFQCPFSGRSTPTIDQLFKEYLGKIRFCFRHYPLPFHIDAPLASEAALAAESQGKFWEMHDKLFANPRNLTRDDLEKYAQELGLDMPKFKEALDAGVYKGRIAQDMTVAGEVGANGTPTFFINGRMISGAQPVEAFKAIIDEELTTAQKLVANGTPPEKLYDTLMASAGTAVAKPASPARR